MRLLRVGKGVAYINPDAIAYVRGRVETIVDGKNVSTRVNDKIATIGFLGGVEKMEFQEISVEAMARDINDFCAANDYLQNIGCPPSLMRMEEDDHADF